MGTLELEPANRTAPDHAGALRLIIPGSPIIMGVRARTSRAALSYWPTSEFSAPRATARTSEDDLARSSSRPSRRIAPREKKKKEERKKKEKKKKKKKKRRDSPPNCPALRTVLRYRPPGCFCFVVAGCAALARTPARAVRDAVVNMATSPTTSGSTAPRPGERHWLRDR